MNPDFPNRLAAQLRDNPSFLQEMDDILLGELVGYYYEGELDAEDAAEVASMLQTNPKAIAIYQRIEAADRFAASPAGKTWLENLRNGLLSSRTDSPESASASALFIRGLESLARAITELFATRATLATASGDEGLVRTLDDGQTRIALKSDSAGRLWLRVTSKVRTGSFKFDVEPAAPILTFSEIEPGLYSARICVDAELAAALEKGVPKLTPLPPGKP